MIHTRGKKSSVREGLSTQGPTILTFLYVEYARSLMEVPRRLGGKTMTIYHHAQVVESNYLE